MITVNSTSPWVTTNSSHGYYCSTPGIVRLNHNNLEVQSPSGDWTYVPPSQISVGLTSAADSALSWAMSKMMEEQELTSSLNQSVGLPSNTKISETLQAQVDLVNQVSETVNKALIQLDKERKKLAVLTQLSIDHNGTA